MIVPYVKTTYLEVFQFSGHLKKKKKKNRTTSNCALLWNCDNLHNLQSVSFQEVANHPAAFTKINVPHQ